MAKNVSVERFRKLTEDLKKEVHEQAVAELNRQATDLAETIKSVAPIYEGSDPDVRPGALKESVQLVPDKKRDTLVRIVAGGPLTTARTVGGTYDYARAIEFGTQEIKPQPFFFPTYRLKKKKMIAAMKRKIAASIKKRSAPP